MSSRRVVVVTGASAGVGRAVAREFAREGAHVGLVARGRPGLEAARREVESAGGVARVEIADVSRAEEVERAAAAIEASLGPIDVWINNAIVTALSPVGELDPADFRRITEVNYLGTVYGTMAALRRMRPRDRGTIVQVGSALSYRAIPLQAAYCGSKFAIRGFTDSLRTELLHEGSAVHVTMVQLPALNTPQFTWCKTSLPRHPQPVPPIYQPEVAARAIHFAAGARRREVWVGWPAVRAIVGNKLAPAIADRYLARLGYDAQQADLPLAADRRHNLFAPIEEDRGAHGPFERREHEWSPQLWATRHRRALLTAAGVAVLAGVAALALGD